MVYLVGAGQVPDNDLILLCLQHESNVHLSLRTGLFYPLNYGGDAENIPQKQNAPSGA